MIYISAGPGEIFGVMGRCYSSVLSNTMAEGERRVRSSTRVESTQRTSWSD
jgi:hypothetical protein